MSGSAIAARPAVRVALAAVVVAAASIGLGSSASGLLMPSAGWVRASAAPLVDADGVASGCVVTTPDLRLHVAHDGGTRLVRSHRLLCDDDWGFRVWTVGLFELMPDGSRVTLEPMARVAAGSGPQAGVTDIWRTAEPCSMYPGSHAFVARANVKVKAAEGDDHPYSAVVERVTTLTCPSD